MQKVLVTGVTGLLGNNLVRKLLAAGRQVRVLVRADSDPRPLAGLDVEPVEGDLRQPDQLAAACDGVEGVIHAGGYVAIGWTDKELSQAINADGARHLAEAARQAGAAMVHVSTVNTLGLGSPDAPANEDSPFTAANTPSSYALSKREAERAVLVEVERGLRGMIVHPGYMLGPWDWKPSSGRMLLEVARRFTPISPRGGCSLCDVRDVADGAIAALDRGRAGRRYILAGHNMLYHDLWRLFAAVSHGKPPWLRAAGTFLPMAAGRLGDLQTRFTGSEPEVNSATTRMSSQYHFYSSQRAIDELGYRIRPAEESVADAWAWFVEHGYIR
ncbi:NAD-dependent epimerase/dehydratase family protein [Lignipirellula cremea]|uniref:3 beta-hydroxysteroid dehydrogenase/Delta 5-->4-isomerase n=1 Tax=Lignipirellula cremea TaxID=2528010 RepID=A0A518DR33_9BACT|nr:NAD-dependent epimerase/dehydratase family protein [Lignipirellula cremea]QDU94289.1 3 beta-hydroxysteroid dehydrogenase/Delta 5-->4-isomerase [Lignipirellula cremea]